MPGSVRDLRARPLLLLVAAALLSCSPPVDHPEDGGDAGPPDGDLDAGDGDLGDADQGGETDADLGPLVLTSVQPGHGPFTGGSAVVLRGRGFAEGLTVFFGERQVEPLDLEVVDDNRVSVLTPPGDPGPVDVTVTRGGETSTLEDGFVYDAWYLDPQRGSAAGGTLVRILGFHADFDPGSLVTFDGVEAVDVAWVSADEMSCRTPPGAVGSVDVAVTSGESTSVLVDGFTYYDSSDPHNGGLGGGPIEGTVDVTVLDAMTAEPLPDSFVMLGADPATPFQGRTDLAGRITFSAPSLVGRQSITASHAPVDLDETGESQITYESQTFVSFDARSVTILLEPFSPPEVGPPPAGRRGGYIEGELLFEHDGEFGPYEWDIVPEPGPDEAKVAYVYTTQASVRSGRMEPGVDGVVFNSADFIGINGYRFSIYASPGTMAVYAFAGLATLDPETQDIVGFTPYAMGLTRGIVVGPEETVTGVQVLVTRQMSRNLTIELENAPLADESGTPNLYLLDVYLDLGAEGVISRPETQIRSTSPHGAFEIPGWVDLTGNLASASYTVVAGAWTTWGGSPEEQNPWSVVYRTGVTEVEEPIVVDEFLAIPRALSPEPGAVVSDNHMEWEATGPTTPTFSVATLEDPTMVVPVPYWTIVLRGGVTAYDLPDLTAIADMPEPPAGNVIWTVWSFTVPGLEFDSWSYRYLVNRYWSAYAVDMWYVRLR
jgi:hypothetical protein